MQSRAYQMRALRTLFLIAAVLDVCVCYKFLIYSPFLGHSHVKFLGTIADVLTEGGHNVTVLMPEIDDVELNRTGVRLTKRIIRTEGDPRAKEALNVSRYEEYRHVWTSGSSVLTMLQIARSRAKMMSCQCETLINDNELLDQLRSEKFDAGISEAYYICGLGDCMAQKFLFFYVNDHIGFLPDFILALFEMLNIRATMAATALTQLNTLAYAIGEPTLPSYVPGDFTDTESKMSLIGRLQNVLKLLLERRVLDYIYESELTHVRKKFGSFKTYNELIAQASFLFTNSNPYLDFPLPTIHKTVMIGGITAVQQRADIQQGLDQEWNSILDARNQTVLVSFGSMARSADMPDNHKRVLLEVFASMPDVTFIWKFEGDNLENAATYPNVHLKPWVPQQQLLDDNRLALFLTHGGIASTYEIAYSGKPAIVVPIFGDQMRNAHMLARHGGALYLDKSSISNAVLLRNAFQTVLSDRSYALNAQRLALQLRHQPVSPRELLLKHAEFAARFGQLPNLDPYGRHLTIFQYYLIDIALTGLVATIALIAATGLLIKKCCFSRPKTKTE